MVCIRYAQDRYEQLTGRKSPIAGGPPRRTVSAEDRKLDDQARQIVAREAQGLKNTLP